VLARPKLRVSKNVSLYDPTMRSLTCLGFVVVLGLGCAQDPPELGESQSAIIGGELDTTHEAVVLLASKMGLCSGTIVKVDAARKVGWVLTAAHCVTDPPEAVLQGPDFAAQGKAIRYAVLDFKAHPQYSESSFARDIAVVRILGVDASTPVIPIAGAADGVVRGTPVLSIGYGRTTPSNQAPDMNTRRKRIAKTITNVSAVQLQYSLSGGGICSGDSGGPVLTTNGGEKVVGVHSTVSGDCLVDGNSVRVSSELAFINAELTRAVPAQTSCTACLNVQTSGNFECAKAERACLSDATCGALVDCYQKCVSESCRVACRAKHSGAEGKFNKVVACGCRVGCKTECTNLCPGVPKCGAAGTGACVTCGEGACCNERLAASFDDVAVLCLKDSTLAGCDASGAYKAYARCLESQCAEPCGLSPSPPEEPVPGEEPPPTTNAAVAEQSTGCSTAPRSMSFMGAFMMLFVLLRRRRLA
jgi:uncharacterized protein (TIGR03382 family)